MSSWYDSIINSLDPKAISMCDESLYAINDCSLDADMLAESASPITLEFLKIRAAALNESEGFDPYGVIETISHVTLKAEQLARYSKPFWKKLKEDVEKAESDLRNPLRQDFAELLSDELSSILKIEKP